MSLRCRSAFAWIRPIHQYGHLARTNARRTNARCSSLVATVVFPMMIAASFIAGIPRNISAQQSGVSAEKKSSQAPVTVTGTVMKPTSDTVLGVPRVWVTLHRVGSDRAGPVDSVQTDANGKYRITYRPFGVESAVYFTASVYHGIAYFSAPVGRGDHASATNLPGEASDSAHGPPGEEGDITVFDTTSGPVRLSARGRHLVVSLPTPSGERKITEVFEIANDSFVTKVAVGNAPEGAAWSALLPEGAQNPKVLEGDLSAEAVKFNNGRVFVYSPFAPGLKQVAYTYTLKGNAFPFSLPLEGETTVLEVLTEESNAKVSGARLKQVAPVTIEGRNFRRFLASDVPANSVVGIEVTEAERPINPIYVAILTLLIGGTMVGALVWTMRRRR